MTGSSDAPLTLDASSWEDELLTDVSHEERAQLSALDRETIFAALVQVAERDEVEGAEVTREADEGRVSADAPLLVPRTRIFIPAGAVVKDAFRRFVKLSAVYAFVGMANPAAGFIGLTIDVLDNIWQKTSKLDAEDAEVVRAVLELRRAEDGAAPSSDAVAAALPEVDDAAKRLEALEGRGVLEREGDGWKVTF